LSKQNQRHIRTRKDHKSETAEDYVEAVADFISEKSVCRVSDLANFFAVSHVTVSKIVSRLKTAGYLTSQPYGPVELTSKGAKLASDCKTRHKIVVDFLIALGVEPTIAETDAEGMEHHVSQETLAIFQSATPFLGRLPSERQ
jgi:DtxR family transcriptional regulator, manganese transport regulator